MTAEIEIFSLIRQPIDGRLIVGLMQRHPSRTPNPSSITTASAIRAVRSDISLTRESYRATMAKPTETRRGH